MCGIFAYSGEGPSPKTLEQNFHSISHRGPDSHVVAKGPDHFIGFHRLAIMDLSSRGNQPFASTSWVLVCNAEIYNSPALRSEFPGFRFASESDCEVILALLERNPDPCAICQQLDGEFAWVAWDKKSCRFVAGRDPLGIRPLFYGRTGKPGSIAFASEAKALHGWCYEVHPFPPGHVFDGQRFVPYCDVTGAKGPKVSNPVEAMAGIRDRLMSAVDKRLTADAPLGFLLSGGLDSSLVCALAARHGRKLRTFSVGIDHDPIDLGWARRVATHLNTEHTEIIFTMKDVLNVIPEIVAFTETWDVTTIRASIGMYLLCKGIREKTDIKALLTGEVSDELFGYKYTDFAPTPEAFQKEAEKRILEIFQYDVLRADRCLAAHAFEARVPFADWNFVDFVMSIDPKLKMNTTGVGKYLLRQSFANDNLLPHDILFREKAAFSDAVGHSMVDGIKAEAETLYSDAELAKESARFNHGTPLSKEGLMYRNLFEEIYPGRAHWIKDHWLPNRSWQNCNVTDPSARQLPNYGKSGV